MRMFFKAKDGGTDSTVTGYWLIESKRLFSVCLLRFDGPSRQAFHTHAFNCLTWVLSGGLRETFHCLLGRAVRFHRPSFLPFITQRTDFHKVDSIYPRTWVLTFRGPWTKSWKEYHPLTNQTVQLQSGRRVADSLQGAHL